MELGKSKKLEYIDKITKATGKKLLLYGQSLVQAHNFRTIICAVSIACDEGTFYS